ncbi:hypothetical protein CL629_03845 [bacterium]|nr:hypothetical protein [bacterium]|tara:strand:+ start:21603 stop:21905 length:303 start_codon:yes stop_codon:yes gene_type:complete
MTPTLLLGIVIGIVITVGAYKLWKREHLPKNILLQRREKDKRKEQILGMFKTKKEITNNDVEWLLGVADSTATKYLQELEKERKIVQVGEKGRYVHYRLK